MKYLSNCSHSFPANYFIRHFMSREPAVIDLRFFQLTFSLFNHKKWEEFFL